MMKHLAQNMIEEILATINRELFFLKILKNNKKMKLPLVVSFFCIMFAAENDKTSEKYE